MDLALFLRVIWRFKWLVLPGILVAIGLAGLSFVRVSDKSPYISYRQHEQWISYSNVLVTQHGFPWGQVATGTQSSADPSRFIGLSVIWSQLALSDPVKQILRRSGPINGTLEVAPVLDANTQEALPLISVAAIADKPRTAITLARRETAALLSFLETQQADSSIKPENQISMLVTSQAAHAKLFKGRSKTMPVVIFLTVLMAVVGLAFVLENLRPRIAPVRQTEARRREADVAA